MALSKGGAATVVVMTIRTTAENMALWFCQQIQEKLDAGLAQVPVSVKEVTVWETEKNIAVYRP